MRYLLFIFLLFLLPSCAVEDDYVPTSIEPIFMDNPSAKLLVDIIYVVPSKNHNQSKYEIDESRFMDFINGCFFNRHNIGFEMGESRVLINSELYDLKDNRDQESSVFHTETQDSYRQDRMNVYIIPRTNTIAIAGIGLKQRALITDEFLFTTTTPHEIGHALGLSHREVEGNIMCKVKPYLRKEFDSDQVDTMFNKILSIN